MALTSYGKAKTAGDTLQNWFHTYGAPEEILSNGGPPFNSQEYNMFLYSWGTKSTHYQCTIPRVMDGQNWPSKCPSGNSQYHVCIDGSNWVTRCNCHSSQEINPVLNIPNYFTPKTVPPRYQIHQMTQHGLDSNINNPTMDHTCWHRSVCRNAAYMHPAHEGWWKSTWKKSTTTKLGPMSQCENIITTLNSIPTDAGYITWVLKDIPALDHNPNALWSHDGGGDTE